MSKILRLGSSGTSARAAKADAENPILKAPVWQSNLSSEFCTKCKTAKFSMFNRRHHCRKCGALCCSKCSKRRALVVQVSTNRLQRVCDDCYNEIVQVETREDRSLLHRSLNSDQLLRLRRDVKTPPSSLASMNKRSNVEKTTTNSSTVVASSATSPRKKETSPTRRSPSPTKDEYVTIRVPVPPNAKAGMVIKVRHEGYVLKVGVPADAAARGSGTFPARIKTSALKEASTFAIATVDRKETIAKLRFEHDHVASQLRDARKQIEKLKKQLEACKCSGDS